MTADCRENVFVARYIDPEGITRAWAYGPVGDALKIRSRAATELARYRLEKAGVGDSYLANAVYAAKQAIRCAIHQHPELVPGWVISPDSGGSGPPTRSARSYTHHTEGGQR